MQQRTSFGLVVEIQNPNLGDGAAPIGLGVVTAQTLAGKVQLLAIWAQCYVVGITYGQRFKLRTLEAEWLGMRPTVECRCRQQQVTRCVGSPKAHLRIS